MCGCVGSKECEEFEMLLWISALSRTEMWW